MAESCTSFPWIILADRPTVHVCDFDGSNAEEYRKLLGRGRSTTANRTRIESKTAKIAKTGHPGLASGGARSRSSGGETRENRTPRFGEWRRAIPVRLSVELVRMPCRLPA